MDMQKRVTMKKDLERKQKLHEKAQNESLVFQTMFGAKQKYGEISTEIETRLKEEILVIKNLGIAEDLLTLKTIIDRIKQEIGYRIEPSKEILACSYVAYCLGLEPFNPTDTQIVLNTLDFKQPIYLSICYDNEIRNKVVDWMKANGYEISSYLGQPLLKLKKVRIVIRRVVKS